VDDRAGDRDRLARLHECFEDPHNGGVRITLWVLVALLTVQASAGTTPLFAQPAHTWAPAVGGVNLVRPAFWEGLAEATASDGSVSVETHDSSSPLVDRYGPRLDVPGDFRLTASVQSDTDGLAVLTVLDDVPEDEWGPTMRRVELGLDDGAVVVNVFDGSGATPSETHAADTDTPQGPTTLGLSRVGSEFVVEVSGAEALRFDDPGVFSTGRVLLGARVADGNRLTLDGLDVQTPYDTPAAVHVERCAPPRLLIAGEDDTAAETGLWWVWPDDNGLRQVEDSHDRRSYLLAVSADKRWVLYYQKSSTPSDRFIVDTWVMDLATDQRTELVDGSAPLGWIADGSAVVLGERPYLMATVPTGELVPTVGQMAPDDPLRQARSPDGQLRATVATTPTGAGGIRIFAAGATEPMRSIPTGRGAVELAWSPDSTRLAYTSGDEGPFGLIWRLRIYDLAEGTTTVVDTPGDLQVHSVVWVPPLPGCGA
jgi:hypothetical protein